MKKLCKTKPISVEKTLDVRGCIEKYSWGGFEKHHLQGVLKTNTSKRPKLTQLCPPRKRQRPILNQGNKEKE